MNMPRAGGIINQSYKDKQSLYSCYMPFVKGGGHGDSASAEMPASFRLKVKLAFRP